MLLCSYGSGGRAGAPWELCWLEARLREAWLAGGFGAANCSAREQMVVSTVSTLESLCSWQYRSGNL